MTWYFPTLHELVRIIPVAQSQTCGDTTLTLLSLECYADGWIINLRVLCSDPHIFPFFNFHPKYDQRRQQFGGAPGYGPWHYHNDDRNFYLSFLKHPALDAEPIPLVFFVPVVQFLDCLPSPEQARGAVLVAEEWGPWLFTVDVSGGISAKEREPTEPSWKPLKEAERARRQERTLPLYGTIFETLLAIFYKYDPARIAWLDPSGAGLYEKVAVNVHRGLLYARSASDARAVVAYEFHDEWHGMFEEGARFDAMVEEVWEAWNREGVSKG